jgi:diaminohydroxyphosphoribosylaminopyrimidine deaminase/5-amino-6-(5-phosphoribosylamino)uracil reductase
MASQVEVTAMRRALALAASPGVPVGPNPRVGCVLLGPDGSVVAEGFHRGAGTPHAEADALARAGSAAVGTTAVVTLEPCDHTGRTGPCSRALVAAGVARVVYAQDEPSPVAAGGARTLRAAGIDVEGGLLADEATALNHEWTFGATAGRPYVTWKTATSLDGRVAAADGTSRWITGPAARADVHALRSVVDAVVVGTGTALADDPALTVRAPDGTPAARQPLRVVVGRRPLPERCRLLDGTAETMVWPGHDPVALGAALAARDVQHVLLEGGPTLAGAFVAAGLVDRVVAYVAPVLLGRGPSALGDAGITTLAGALRLQTDDVTLFGPDVRITARVLRAGEAGQ